MCAAPIGYLQDSTSSVEFGKEHLLPSLGSGERSLYAELVTGLHEKKLNGYCRTVNSHSLHVVPAAVLVQTCVSTRLCGIPAGCVEDDMVLGSSVALQSRSAKLADSRASVLMLPGEETVAVSDWVTCISLLCLQLVLRSKRGCPYTQNGALR